MKNIFTQITLFLLALLPANSLRAQDIGSLQGYTNVYIRFKTAIEGTGKVSVTPPTGGLDTYKEVFDFQRTLPVAINSVYFNVKVRAENGNFVGWYLDNGDGVFDMLTDELINNEDKVSPMFIPLSILGIDDETLPATEAEAQQAAKPTQPQALIFAFITNGASATIDNSQESCGTVEISNPLNKPGDVVTIKAIPAEGYKFEYWKTAYGSQFYNGHKDTSVSKDAEYTFTVKGGEQYYAYFSEIDAPTLQFPEEGGWMATSFNTTWFLHELSDAFIYNPILSDVKTNAEEQSYMNLDDEDALYDNTRKYITAERGYGNNATLIYGKGTVRFTHRSPNLGFDRANNILEWSGPKGITINDKNNDFGYHVYVFNNSLGAFIKLGTTDLFVDANAPKSITVPRDCCYICLEGYDIADPNSGYIPDIIGMTPEAYNNAVSGIATTKNDVAAQRPVTIYDILGRRVANSQRHNGKLLIVNGKKTISK